MSLRAGRTQPTARAAKEKPLSEFVTQSSGGWMA